MGGASDPVIVKVRVTARASRRGIAGRRDDEIVVRLSSAPVDGAANHELVDVIADALRIPKRNVIIVSGLRSRSKRVAVTGIDAASVFAALASAIR